MSELAKNQTTAKTLDETENWISEQPNTAAAVHLTVVVPAYNEERRLPPTLLDMVDYLDTRAISYEIIVVDDGSSDATAETVRKFERVRQQVKLIHLPKNGGKGYAVKLGVLNARGERILFADADGATPIQELARLEHALDSGAYIAFGSRAIASTDTTVRTRLLRRVLGRVFNACVNLIVLPDISDTQCGFKLFRRDAARFVFERQQAERYSFDVEILYIARRAGIACKEVPINWTNVPGSKVNLIFDSLRMLRDIIGFRMRHSAVRPGDFEI